MAAGYICRRYVLNDDELSSTFDLLDLDKDGKLGRGDITLLLRTIKVEATKAELDSIFSELDPEQSGKVDKRAFIKYMRCPLLNRITIGEFEEQFRLFDYDGDGSINEEELKGILAKTADLRDTHSVHELFEATDADGDGLITFAEFMRMVME